MTFTTTLNKIRKCGGLLTDDWEKLLRNLGKTEPDDEPLTLLTILQSNGMDDALWCCRTVSGHDMDFRLFCVWCARQVQHLMVDARSLDALDVAERYAHGEASAKELAAAQAAAQAAALVAERLARGTVRGSAERRAQAAANGAVRAATWAIAQAIAQASAEEAAEEARFRKMLADGAFIGSTHPEASDE